MMRAKVINVGQNCIAPNIFWPGTPMYPAGDNAFEIKIREHVK